MFPFRTKVKVGMAKYSTLSTIQQVYIYRNIDSTTQINYYEYGSVKKTHPDFFPHSPFFGPILLITFYPYSQTPHLPTFSFNKPETSLPEKLILLLSTPQKWQNDPLRTLQISSPPPI